MPVRGAASVAAALLAVSVSAGAQPRFHLTDLGPSTQAVAINEKGEIVGNDNGVQSVWHDGTWKPLELPPRLEPVAVAINAKGMVTGYAFESQQVKSRERAVLWKHEDHGYVLKTGEGGDSYARSMSDDGTVVGGVRPKGLFHAVSWKGGELVDLGLPRGAIAAVATAIDKSGTKIAGVAGMKDRTHEGFLYENGVFRLIGNLTGAGADVAAINRQGLIVGSAYKHDSHHAHAFAWQGHGIQFLGTLGGYESHAYAVNDDGVIVGEATDKHGQTRAFLYEDGQMKALSEFVDDALGLSLVEAQGINDAGQIVGLAADHQGIWHGYRLDPLQ